MSTTGHWYVNPSGAKVDFTDPSTDIDFSGAVPLASHDLRKVVTHSGARPEVVLWKGTGTQITTAEITAAIADQDSASVPTIAFAVDAPSGQGSAIAKPAAVTTANAATQTASYVQADAQTIAALTNANKTAINACVAAIGHLVDALVANGTISAT